MFHIRKAVTASVLVFLILVSAEVSAYCGSLDLSDEKSTRVALGSLGNSSGTHAQRCLPVDLTEPFQLFACVKTEGSPAYLVPFEECTSDTPENDNVLIKFGSENDVLIAVNDVFGYQKCGREDLLQGTADAICPDGWNNVLNRFQFGITAYMGDGSDSAHGSPNNDQLYSGPGDIDFSNDAMTTPRDSARDVLCGYGGDDVLVGDWDTALQDDASNLREVRDTGECLYGGDGSDRCDGRDSTSISESQAAKANAIVRLQEEEKLIEFRNRWASEPDRQYACETALGTLSGGKCDDFSPNAFCSPRCQIEDLRDCKNNTRSKVTSCFQNPWGSVVVSDEKCPQGQLFGD